MYCPVHGQTANEDCPRCHPASLAVAKLEEARTDLYEVRRIVADYMLGGRPTGTTMRSVMDRITGVIGDLCEARDLADNYGVPDTSRCLVLWFDGEDDWRAFLDARPILAAMNHQGGGSLEDDLAAHFRRLIASSEEPVDTAPLDDVV